MEPLIQDEKYVVFKSGDSISITDGYVTFATDAALEDAVVIRRQDLFASSALAVYANTIALVARTTPDEVLAKRLMNVADYFHQQSEAAAEQGFKFPD